MFDINCIHYIGQSAQNQYFSYIFADLCSQYHIPSCNNSDNPLNCYTILITFYIDFMSELDYYNSELYLFAK